MVIRLGTVRPSRTPLKGVHPQVDAGSFGAGVGEALQNLGQTFEGLAEKLEQKKKETNRTNALIGLTDLRSGLEDDILSMEREGELGAPEHTNNVEKLITKGFNEYIEQVSPDLKDEFTFRFNTTRRKLISAAFAHQLDAEDTLFTTKFMTMRDRALTNVYQDSSKLDVEVAILTELLMSSSLPSEDKAELLLETDRAMREAVFSGELENEFAFGGNEPVVAASEIPDQGGAFLNILSGPESGNRYNVRNDGSPTGATFDDFSKHPNVPVTLPDGTITTAAGRYGIIFETWERMRKHLKLPDFGPESQDRANWHLAQSDYKTITGRDLLTDLQEGDPTTLKNIREKLIPTWDGLRKITPDEFASHFGAMKVASELPDPMNDPRFVEGPGAIPFDRRVILDARAKRVGEARRKEAQRAYLAGENGQRWQDSMAFWNATGEDPPGSPYTDVRISELFPPAEAAQMIALRDQAINDGVRRQVLKLITPEDWVVVESELVSAAEAPGNDQHDLDELAAVRRLKLERDALIGKDPNGYVMFHDEALVQLQGVVIDADEKPDDSGVSDAQRAVTALTMASLEAQERLGVPVFLQRVLSEQKVQSMKVNIEESELKFQGAMVKSIIDLYRDDAPQALKELFQAGLPPVLYHAGIMFESDPGLATLIASIPENSKEWFQGLQPGDKVLIEEEVFAAFAPWSAVFTAGDISGTSSQAVNDYRSTAGALVARMRANNPDADIATLAAQVYKSLVENQYHIIDSGRINAYIPKGFGDEAAKRHIENVATGLLGPKGIELMDLGLLNILGAELNQESTNDQIASTATWVTDRDGEGLMLVMPVSNDEGDFNLVVNKAGQVIRVSFQELLKAERFDTFGSVLGEVLKGSLETILGAP